MKNLLDVGFLLAKTFTKVSSIVTRSKKGSSSSLKDYVVEYDKDGIQSWRWMTDKEKKFWNK